jgi:hypothetical protein
VTSSGKLERSTISGDLPVNALFFYGPDSGVLKSKDNAALERLAASGIDVSGAPLYIVVDRMMLNASCSGLVTNALGSSRSWGPKHIQELKLRRYESATGQLIVRPRTLIARPFELRAVLSRFSSRGKACLIKPAFGEGGRGFQIVRPGDAVPQCENTVVVQQLIADPLLIEGHKADIRFYLLIDVNDERSSGRVGPVFLRRAAIPYIPQSLPAEITNTAYRLSRGLPPDMRILAEAPCVSPDLRNKIASELDSLARLLVDAWFRDAEANGNLVPNRVILFGIDALVASPLRSPRLYFLEWNPFPGLYRDLRNCDAAVDEMISRDYLPFLARSGVDLQSVDS